MRKASLRRVTTETQIQLALTIEGRGRYEVSTGIRFFDHMLELFARHGAFDWCPPLKPTFSVMKKLPSLSRAGPYANSW